MYYTARYLKAKPRALLAPNPAELSSKSNPGKQQNLSWRVTTVSEQACECPHSIVSNNEKSCEYLPAKEIRLWCTCALKPFTDKKTGLHILIFQH